MNLNDVILQLRHECPMFEGRVAGAAEFAQAWENSSLAMAMPCAYAIPAADEPGPNGSLNGLRQEITEAFTIYAFLDNRLDRRGQTAVTIAISDVRAALFKGILNWRLDPNQSPKGLRYMGGNLEKSDRAVLVYSFDFAHEIVVDHHDGFVEDSDPWATTTINIVPPTGANPITERPVRQRVDINMNPED